VAGVSLHADSLHACLGAGALQIPGRHYSRKCQGGETAPNHQEGRHVTILVQGRQADTGCRLTLALYLSLLRCLFVTFCCCRWKAVKEQETCEAAVGGEQALVQLLLMRYHPNTAFHTSPVFCWLVLQLEQALAKCLSMSTRLCRCW
jgi:hypothetical protein